MTNFDFLKKDEKFSSFADIAITAEKYKEKNQRSIKNFNTDYVEGIKTKKGHPLKLTKDGYNHAQILSFRYKWKYSYDINKVEFTFFENLSFLVFV